MAFASGEEVSVALNKHSATGTATGVVVRTTPDRIQIALRGRGLLLKPGLVVHICPNSDRDDGGWALVESTQLAGDVKLVEVSNFTKDKTEIPRAARCSVQATLTAAAPGEASELIGQCVNLSLSGACAIFRTPLGLGSSINLHFKVEESGTIEAAAKVVRQRHNPEEGHYEVGLEFHRFVRGYELLTQFAPCHLEAVTGTDGKAQVA